jgi:NAD(P)-dependent dehydrogenase (short-subunit alcohol dehydrogenase family)
MKNKIAIITGASDGIGLAAATALAKKGTRLGLVGRNPAKMQRAVDQIKSIASDAQVETFLADLSEMRQVKAAADAIKARYKHIDVLFNNAGAAFAFRRETAEGLERTFALNHLAYLLLTTELLDPLKAGDHARIISTSSSANYRGNIHLDDLQLNQRYAMMRAYGQSKLANVLFTRKLARDLQNTGITANCFHPGLVATNIGQSGNTIFARIVQPLMFQLRGAISPERGADTGLYLIESPDVAGISGAYFYKRAVTAPHPAADDIDLQERLWAESERLIEKALA